MDRVFTTGDETTTTKKNPDGSITTTRTDHFHGSVPITTTTFPDGSITRTRTNPDGRTTTTRTQKNPDGSVTETSTYPDGSWATTTDKANPDDSRTRTTTHSDGSTTSYTTFRDGTWVETDRDGKTTYHDPYSGEKTTQPPGSPKQERPVLNIKPVTLGGPLADPVIHLDPGPATTPEEFVKPPTTTVAQPPRLALTGAEGRAPGIIPETDLRALVSGVATTPERLRTVLSSPDVSASALREVGMTVTVDSAALRTAAAEAGLPDERIAELEARAAAEPERLTEIATEFNVPAESIEAAQPLRVRMPRDAARTAETTLNVNTSTLRRALTRQNITVTQVVEFRPGDTPKELQEALFGSDLFVPCGSSVVIETYRGRVARVCAGVTTPHSAPTPTEVRVAVDNREQTNVGIPPGQDPKEAAKALGGTILATGPQGAIISTVGDPKAIEKKAQEIGLKTNFVEKNFCTIMTPLTPFRGHDHKAHEHSGRGPHEHDAPDPPLDWGVMPPEIVVRLE